MPDMPDFNRRLAASGYSPSPAHEAEMRDAFPYLAEMLACLPADLGFADEPASAFTADAMPEGAEE